ANRGTQGPRVRFTCTAERSHPRPYLTCSVCRRRSKIRCQILTITACAPRPFPQRACPAARSRSARPPSTELTLDKAVGEPIVHRLVNYQPRNLDRVFATLADPTRRAILARLAREESLTISALA